MNRLELIQRVRSLTRDLSNSIFREVDIINYINEGIDRAKQILPDLDTMPYLDTNEDEPQVLPSKYHQLLSLYSTSRCFGQDERHYQATNYMNEFEAKMQELKEYVQLGTIVLVDANQQPITSSYTLDYVEDNYFTKRTQYVDLDDGVEGIE